MTKGKQYGKDATPNPAVSKYARLSADSAGGEVSWEEVDGRLIKGAIAAASADGCALIFSKTQDGGALSLTLLAGTERHKKYGKSAELMESVLQELIATAAS